MPELAVVGNLVKDIVGGTEPRPGGVVYYTARALAALEPSIDVRLVTRCSEQDAPALLPALEAFGLPVTWRPAGETQTFRFHYEDERRVMELVSLGDPWTEADVRGWVGDAIGESHRIVLGALTRGDFTPAGIRALAGGERRLLVDSQGLVRLRLLGPLVQDAGVDRFIYDLIAALKLDEEEASTLAGGLDPDTLRRLGVPELVVTMGSRGALVVTDDVAELVPAVEVAGPVDPTGAGDTFWVAYVLGRRDGLSPVEAATRATAFVAGMLAPR
jgi:sugar/nucleoside kinase (ribokinase family)